MTTTLQNLAAARGQDDDLRWVFLYDLKDKSLLGGIGVLCYGGGASVSHFYADTPELAAMLLDLGATTTGFTLAGIAPMKPGTFRSVHDVGLKELFDRSAGARLPLNRWKQTLEEVSGHDDEYDDE